MRKWVVLVAGAIACVSSIAAAQGGIERTYAVGPFAEIAAAGPHRVVVTVGGAPSIRASGAAAALDKMEAVVVRDELRIRPKKEYRNNFSWRDLPPATFYVSAPALEGVSLSGSGDMTVDRVRGSRFEAALAGSGDLVIARLDAKQTSFAVAGSGALTVSGRADAAEVTLAGSGAFNGRELVSKTGNVTIAGSGDAQLTAQDSAKVSIVGSGGADIGGTATCSVSRLGSGRVRCGA